MGRIIDFKTRAVLNDEEKEQALMNIDTHIQRVDNALMDLLQVYVDECLVLEDTEVLDIEGAHLSITALFKSVLKDPTHFSSTQELRDWLDTLAAYDATTITEEDEYDD